jgi:hypoxanthine phosphoribosyltransferase
VRERIEALASRIFHDYAGRPIVCVVIEKGARIFAIRLADRLRALGMKPELVFVHASRTQSSRLVPVEVGPIDPRVFRGREVLLVDDIADEGRTLEAVAQLARTGDPRSLRAAVLVSKQARRKVNLEIEYIGFEIEKGWVVGVGMDLDGRFRDLDHLGIVEGLD